MRLVGLVYSTQHRCSLYKWAAYTQPWCCAEDTMWVKACIAVLGPIVSFILDVYNGHEEVLFLATGKQECRSEWCMHWYCKSTLQWRICGSSLTSPTFPWWLKAFEGLLSAISGVIKNPLQVQFYGWWLDDEMISFMEHIYSSCLWTHRAGCSRKCHHLITFNGQCLKCDNLIWKICWVYISLALTSWTAKNFKMQTIMHWDPILL